MGLLKNNWFLRENLQKWMIWGYSVFRKPPLNKPSIWDCIWEYAVRYNGIIVDSAVSFDSFGSLLLHMSSWTDSINLEDPTGAETTHTSRALNQKDPIRWETYGNIRWRCMVKLVVLAKIARGGFTPDLRCFRRPIMGYQSSFKSWVNWRCNSRSV